MYSEIGSDFWEYTCDCSSNKSLPFSWYRAENSVQFFKSGRNAIKALCQNIDTTNKTVLLPIYTCETVIEPFVDEGWTLFFYRLKRNLSVDIESLKELVEKERPSAILYHHYFGFQTFDAKDLLKEYAKKGIVIVEDLTQILLSEECCDTADYYVTSFRKFFAIPDGGALISRNPLKNVTVNPADINIAETAIEAFSMKSEYFSEMNAEKKLRFREKYRVLHTMISQNSMLAEMNDISMNILHSVDYDIICEKRRSNYMWLCEKLKSIEGIEPVISKPVDDNTPLYFPVYVEDREKFQKYLASKNIYCPVVWPKPKQIAEMDEDTLYMYGHMICIPIDQRYGIEEMNVVIKTIREYLSF